MGESIPLISYNKFLKLDNSKNNDDKNLTIIKSNNDKDNDENKKPIKPDSYSIIKGIKNLNDKEKILHIIILIIKYIVEISLIISGSFFIK